MEMGFPTKFTSTWYLALFAIVLNIFFKCLLVYTISSMQTTSGVKLKTTIWQKAHFFCLPTTKKLPKKLHIITQRRVFSVVWIEFFAILLQSIVFAKIQTSMSWASQFNVDGWFMSLKKTMLLKMLSSIIFIFSLLHNADIPDFLNEFGCMPLKIWYKNRKRLLKRKRGFRAPKILLDDKYMRINMCTKLLDIIMGIFMWDALARAFNLLQGTTPKDIRTTLTLLGITQLSTEIHVTLLCVTIYW